MKKWGFILFILLFAAPAHRALAQNYQQMREEILKKQKSTRAEIKYLNNQIESYRQRLSKAEQQYDKLYEQSEDLKRVIALQDTKIRKLEKEQQHIRDEIDVTQKSIRQNQGKLQRLVEDYKKTLRYLYVHGRTSELALILSSKSINQMLVRSYYLKKFENHRQKQADAIRETQSELEKSKDQLVDAREKNEGVLNEIQEEKKEYAGKKKQLEKNVVKLRHDRKSLKQKLGQVRDQKQQLNQTLDDLIAQEEKIRRAEEERMRKLELERRQRLAEAKKITDASKRAAEVAKYSKPVSTREFVSSEELSNIEHSFEEQKGDLPWPVDNGVVTEKFGRRRDPVLGTTTMNLGVDIATEAETPVHVIHDGYVFAVRPLPGYGDLVFVNHGKFKTVYGNLSKVLVRKNSFLKTGDVVGLAGEKDSAKGEAVFFMIREKNKDLDPEKWLKSK